MQKMNRYQAAAVIFGLLLLALSGAGAVTRIQRGRVVGADGQALDGVSVTGFAAECCTYNHIKTDAHGQFSWDLQTSVFHFSKEGYQPLTIVDRNHKVPHRAVMQRVDKTKTVHSCNDVKFPAVKGDDLWFKLPDGFKLYQSAGIDLIEISIWKHDDAARARVIYFCPAGCSDDAPDAWYRDSSEFAEHAIFTEHGVLTGADASGVKDGLAWRAFRTNWISMRYEGARPELAKQFDAAIDQLCWLDVDKEIQEAEAAQRGIDKQ